MFQEPAIGERFFGREEVLELLNKRVLALKDGYRQNVAFTGPSLAGKTSIIQHFLYSIRKEPFIALYLEIIKEPFKSFANKFIATLLYHTLSKLDEEVKIDLEYLLDRAASKTPKTSAAIKKVFSLMEKNEIDEAYSELLGITFVLKEETNMPCIVILDEFDNLERMGIKNPFIHFGKVIMVQKDTMYIVTSSRREAITKILSEKLALLFGNFEIVNISGFDQKASSLFIDTRLDGFEVDAKIRRFLVAFSSGNPFYLHKLLESSKSIALSALSNFIDEGILAAAMVKEIYESNGVIHQYILNYLMDLIDTKSKENSFAILGAIAGSKNKLKEIARYLKIRQAEAAKILARLTELGLVSRDGVFFKIEDPMLEFWLEHVYRKKREMLVDDIFRRIDILKEEALAFIEGFKKEDSKDIMSALIELFNAFSNELVSVDSRHVRLPHFTKVESRTMQDLSVGLAATFRGNSWIVQLYENKVCENTIVNFIKNVKGSGLKVSNKVIISLEGIDDNARLLAKELKIAIWDIKTVNKLFSFYGKKAIVRV